MAQGMGRVPRSTVAASHPPAQGRRELWPRILEAEVRGGRDDEAGAGGARQVHEPREKHGPDQGAHRGIGTNRCLLTSSCAHVSYACLRARSHEFLFSGM